MKYEDLRAAVEAILFVAKEPVNRDQILAAMDGQLDEGLLDTMVTELEDLYQQPGRGLRLDRVAGGLRISTRPETGTFIRSFLRENNVRRLSPAALETLAVVAYRQPITAPEVQEIRGSDPSGVLKTLLDRRLVRITGKKQVAGRPLLYGTTKEFLIQFGLDTLEDMPDLHHFEEMFGQEARQEWLFPPEGKDTITFGDLDQDPEDEDMEGAGDEAPGEETETESFADAETADDSADAGEDISGLAAETGTEDPCEEPAEEGAMEIAEQTTQETASAEEADPARSDSP